MKMSKIYKYEESLQGAASSWTDCHFFGDWAGFMAAQIWAFNFAKNYELHQYSGDNNESFCFPKCSFKLL